MIIRFGSKKTINTYLKFKHSPYTSKTFSLNTICFSLRFGLANKIDNYSRLKIRVGVGNLYP